jgi:hypothetical protein
MPRGRPRPQGQATKVGLVPVRQPPVLEGASPSGGRENLRAVLGRQLQRPGQEVRMQVRVSGERDRQPVTLSCCPHRPQVPRHIDRQRPPVPQVHQVGRVPQPLIHDGHDRCHGQFLLQALGAAAVLVAAVVIAFTGWTRADPVASLLIGALIVPRTVKLLREAVRVLMEATLRDVDLAEVRAHIIAVEHVHGVHDLHATAVASTLPVLTAHVVVDDSCFADRHLPKLLDQLQQCLAGHFDVEHSTFQFEPAGHAGHEHATHP